MAVTGWQNLTKNQPGPGQYECKSQLSRTKYSIRPRTVNPHEYTTAKTVPGPGTYALNPTINVYGRYANSKFRASKAGLINPARSVRFKRGRKSKVPGPG